MARVLMKFTRSPATEGAGAEVAYLRGYIKALHEQHRKKIDALLAQLRESGHQIADLRIEAAEAERRANEAERRLAGKPQPPEPAWTVEDVLPIPSWLKGASE